MQDRSSKSHADLARDLRLLIREQISKGRSNEQIKSFLVARYGDFILLKPRSNPPHSCSG